MQGFGRTEPDTVRTSFKRRFACYLALHNFPILFCFGLIMFFWYRRAWVGLTGLCPREARATSQGPQATPPGPGWWWGPLNPRLTLILFLTYTGLSTFAHVHPTQWIMHICMHFLHLPFSAKRKAEPEPSCFYHPWEMQTQKTWVHSQNYNGCKNVWDKFLLLHFHILFY